MGAFESVILASGSPRRKELLAACGVSFKVVVPEFDETALPGESAEDVVKRCALGKATVVARSFPRSLVIGGDTLVVVGKEILGKPKNSVEAIEMLGKIQGTTHVVWGGIAVVNMASILQHVETDQTRVHIAPMQRAVIEKYVESGEPLDKAGAYAAQGQGAQFVERIEGSYSNVIGLNIAVIARILRDLKVL